MRSYAVIVMYVWSPADEGTCGQFLTIGVLPPHRYYNEI
jgi:hypothetical protein